MGVRGTLKAVHMEEEIEEGELEEHEQPAQEHKRRPWAQTWLLDLVFRRFGWDTWIQTQSHVERNIYSAMNVPRCQILSISVSSVGDIPLGLF